MKRTLGDLGEDFPKLRKVRSQCQFLTCTANAAPAWQFVTCQRHRPPRAQDIDLANDDIARVKKFQKYLRENMITGIQSQMKIAMALKAEGVLTDRVWYTVHTLIAGNAISKDLKDPFQPISAPINKKR